MLDLEAVDVFAALPQYAGGGGEVHRSANVRRRSDSEHMTFSGTIAATGRKLVRDLTNASLTASAGRAGFDTLGAAERVFALSGARCAVRPAHGGDGGDGEAVHPAGPGEECAGPTRPDSMIDSYTRGPEA